jgi:hypothetical protein
MLAPILNLKNMKTQWLPFLLIIAFACSKSEETAAPAFSFKSQDAAGKIKSSDWKYADGFADKFNRGSDPFIDITLVETQPQKGCDIVIPTGNRVFFVVPAVVALYKLSPGLTGNNYTVTLYEKATGFNVIVGTGAVEILSITATEVTGRIDAQADDKSFVNGNFKVTICP